MIPIATEFRQKPSRDDRKRRQGWKLTAQTCTGSFQLALQLAAQLAVKLAAPALRLQQGDPLLRAQKKKKKEHKHTPQKKPRLSAQLAGCTAGSTTRGAEDVNDTVKEAYTNCHFFSHGARRFLHPRAALLAQRKKKDISRQTAEIFIAAEGEEIQTAIRATSLRPHLRCRFLSCSRDTTSEIRGGRWNWTNKN